MSPLSGFMYRTGKRSNEQIERVWCERIYKSSVRHNSMRKQMDGAIEQFHPTFNAARNYLLDQLFAEKQKAHRAYIAAVAKFDRCVSLEEPKADK